MIGQDASLWWAPLLTLIGTVIGALGAVAGGAFASWFTRQQERQAIAAAFAGEIQGVVEARNWRDARVAIEQGKIAPTAGQLPIFEANVGKIGILPVDLAGKVAVFYADLGGVLLDLTTLRAALKGEIGILNADQIRVRLLQDLEALEGKAKALVLELKREASRTWKEYLQPP